MEDYIPNRQKEYLFNALIGDCDINKQYALIKMYQNSCMIDEMNHRREMEDMEKRITKNVMENLSVSADISKAIQEIEELRRAIDRLGK